MFRLHNADRIRRIRIVSLFVKHSCRIQRDMKRTVQVNVKMTQADFTLLTEAAETRWPDAVMTNSGIVLGLERLAAKQIIGEKKSSPATPKEAGRRSRAK